jgi:hypothetical protein
MAEGCPPCTHTDPARFHDKNDIYFWMLWCPNCGALSQRGVWTMPAMVTKIIEAGRSVVPVPDGGGLSCLGT